MRLLPWFQEAAQRDPTSIGTMANCEKCMQSTTLQIRQGRVCGYEPPAPAHLYVMPWQPPDGEQGFDYGDPSREHPHGDRAPTTCPGYTTRLPEVIEAARARIHWKNGELYSFCGGRPTETLKFGIEVVDGAYSAVQHWKVTPASKGGGSD